VMGWSVLGRELHEADELAGDEKWDWQQFLGIYFA